MGERGPLPKDVVRRRNKRPDPKGTLPVSRPSRPQDLTGEARKEWDRIVPLLEQMGTITELDRGTLIRYCRTWAEWCELNEQIAVAGKLVKRPNGEYGRSPLVMLRKSAERTLSELSQHLGLAPMPRLRSGIKHEQELEEPENKPSSIEKYRDRLAK